MNDEVDSIEPDGPERVDVRFSNCGIDEPIENLDNFLRSDRTESLADAISLTIQESSKPASYDLLAFVNLLETPI